MTDDQILDGLRQCGVAQEAALHELYMVKGRAFCRYFASQGVDPSDADDILQDVILKILANFESLRDGHSFNAWLWQVSRNCLNDYGRKFAASKEDKLDDEQWEKLERDSATVITVSESQRDAQLQDCMIKGLEAFYMADPERAYVLELVVEGVDQREIADRIGRTYGAIRTFICECRKKLAPYVEHCLQFLPT